MKISKQPQLILLQFKPDGNSTFVDFLIIVNPSYTETRLKNVNNKLGKDQRNSGLNLAPSFMEGKSMGPAQDLYKIIHGIVNCSFLRPSILRTCFSAIS